MFQKDSREAHQRSSQKDKEEPGGPNAALYDRPDQEQQERIEHDMGEIVMQEPGREQTPVFVMNLTAIGESAKAKEARIISDRISREFEEEHEDHDA